MKNTEAIHQLIRSLSKAEKRNFKMMASRYSKDQNNYLLLFDAVDKQLVYDETKLRKKFSKYTFGQNIGKTKYLLYDLLLKSLRPLSNTKSKIGQLQSMLQSVDFLTSKGLYKQADKLLKKVKKQAIHYQLFGIQLEILDREKHSIIYDSTKINSQRIKLLLKEADYISSLVRMELRYQAICEKLHLLRLVYSHDQWVSILREELKVVPQEGHEPQPTFLAAVLRKEVFAIAANAEGNALKALSLQEEIHQLWRTHAHLIAIFPTHFVRASQLYIRNLSFRFDHQDQLHSVFNFLQNAPLALNEEAAESFRLENLSLEFTLNFSLENFQICTLLMCHIEEELENFRLKVSLPMQVRFYNSAGCFYFLKNDYEESLQWMAKSLALINQHGIFPDYKFFCQTLELIAHYELGNFQYLESALRNFNRSIGKGNRNGLEYLAVQTIGKLVKAVDRSEKDFIAADFYTLLRQKFGTETLQSKAKKNLLQHWISQYLILQNHEQFN